jgi:hypothetical protein
LSPLKIRLPIQDELTPLAVITVTPVIVMENITVMVGVKAMFHLDLFTYYLNQKILLTELGIIK